MICVILKENVCFSEEWMHLLSEVSEIENDLVSFLAMVYNSHSLYNVLARDFELVSLEPALLCKVIRGR